MWPRRLKHVCRLFAEELGLSNFRGFDSNELLERVIGPVVGAQTGRH